MVFGACKNISGKNETVPERDILLIEFIANMTNQIVYRDQQPVYGNGKRVAAQQNLIKRNTIYQIYRNGVAGAKVRTQQQAFPSGVDAAPLCEQRSISNHQAVLRNTRYEMSALLHTPDYTHIGHTPIIGPKGLPILGSLLDVARTIKKAGDDNYFHQQLLKYGPIVKITTPGESREIKRFVLEIRFVPLQNGWWGREEDERHI